MKFSGYTMGSIGLMDFFSQATANNHIKERVAEQLSYNKEASETDFDIVERYIQD